MKKWIIPVVLILTVSLLATSCNRSSTVKIGFLGVLTGRLSSLGIPERNAVQLAVEEANAAGGIRGKQIELIIRNDEHDEGKARKHLLDMAEQDIPIVIGPSTSQMTMACVDIANEKEILLLSPTTSTTALSDLDDYFMRTTSTNDAEALFFAGYAAETMGLTTIGAFLDSDNEAYTESYLRVFTERFEAAGGTVSILRRFSSSEGLDYEEIGKRASEMDIQGILILTSALDAALIIQSLRNHDVAVPILVNGWAMNNELLQYGGPATDGVLFSMIFYSGSRDPAFLEFRDKFVERFGTEPDFAAVNAYEAARIAIDALKNKKRNQGIKEYILAKKNFPALLGEISFTEYGDVIRDRFIITVENGSYILRE